MPWLKLCFDCRQDNAESLADHLTILGAESVCFEDQADQPIYDPPEEALSLWRQTRLTALFSPHIDMQHILAQLRSVCENLPEYFIESLEDKVWERQWLQYFRPMRFGRHVWICPSHDNPPDPDATNIILDPGLAFGTGNHATTGLCLEWLDEHFKAGYQLIDYG